MAESACDSDAAHRLALHDAVQKYQVPLTGYARTLLGDLDRARDVALDTLLKMCQQPRQTFEQDLARRLAPWLFAVCRNRCIDIIRKERRMTTTEPTTLDQQQAASQGDRTRPLSVVEQRDTADALLGLVDALPDNQREVVQLRFNGQLPYREIAHVTGHSVSHVGVLLHEAIKTLRVQMLRLTA